MMLDFDPTLADYVEMLNYAGDGLRWTLEGTGEAIRDRNTGQIRQLHLRGQAGIESHLEWSYLWDAPQVERFEGTRTERWASTLELVLETDREGQ